MARSAAGSRAASIPAIAVARVSATVAVCCCAIVAPPASGAEILKILLLDLVDLRFDGLRIVLHQLDVLEGRPPRPLRYLRVGRAQGADIDDELLALGAEGIDREEAGGVGMRGILGHGRGAGERGRAPAWGKRLGPPGPLPCREAPPFLSR